MLGKLALVAVLALTVEQCSDRGSTRDRPPPYNQGPGNVGCTVRADHPHWSSGNAAFIVGKVWVTCTGTIDRLTIEAKLQVRRGGGWLDVRSSLPPARTVAPVNPGEPYQHLADFPCAEVRNGDVFRTAGRGSGTFGGKPAGSATWTYAPVIGKEVRCQK